MKISKRAAQVTGSVTLKIDGMAKQMKAEGINVIGFGAGEPDFDTPPHIIEAAKAAMDAGKTRYTPANGILELREAVCRLYAGRGLQYSPVQVVVGNGAKQAIHNALNCLLDEGDEVLLLSPCWVSYPELVAMAGGKAVLVPTDADRGFLPDMAALERAISPRTRVLMINSPCNPCGNIYSLETLEQLAALARKHDLAVIADEIYENLVYSGKAESIAGLEGMTERTVIINGVSKTYAMTGWRIGYALAPEPLAKAMTRWQSHATGNPSSIAQYAALAAIAGPQQCVEDMRQQFGKRRDYMVQRVADIDGLSCPVPLGAFYVMLDISCQIGKTYHGQAGGSSQAEGGSQVGGARTIGGSEDFAELLLQDKAVAAVPCAAFGADEYIRLSYAVSMDDIREGMDRIADFVSTLQK